MGERMKDIHIAEECSRLYRLNGKQCDKIEMPAKMERIVRRAYAGPTSPLVSRFLFSLFNSGWSIEMKRIRMQMGLESV